MWRTVMSGQNIGLGSWPARRARLSPNTVAWRYGEREYTYRQLADRVEAVAGGLRAHGIERGDRGAYFGGNQPGLMTTRFGACRSGAITVLLNSRLSPAEISFMIDDSRPKMLIHGHEVTSVVQRLDPEIKETLNAIDVDSADFTALLREEPPPHVAVHLDDA